MQIKITNAIGYDWIEAGEIYRVIDQTANGYFIKVFGVEFHVLKGDCKVLGGVKS